MTTHTIETTNCGPTNHAGGNSLANAWSKATDAVASIVSSAQAGDKIDESIYDLDDMTLDELAKGLRARGLYLGARDSDGCEICAE